MWHKDDSVNLNGSLSFLDSIVAMKAQRCVSRFLPLDLNSSEESVEGVMQKIWTLDFCHNFVNPLFKDTLIYITNFKNCSGTVTYIFNERLEAGVYRNGDLNVFQAKDLYSFAIEKLALRENQISPRDYDRIKQAWFFHVWGLKHGNN